MQIIQSKYVYVYNGVSNYNYRVRNIIPYESIGAFTSELDILFYENHRGQPG